MALVALVAAFVLPSLATFAARQRLAAVSAEFSAALALARSEAVRTGLPVLLLPLAALLLLLLTPLLPPLTPPSKQLQSGSNRDKKESNAARRSTLFLYGKELSTAKPTCPTTTT